MRELIITKNEDGIRLSKYIKKHFTTMPDSLMHKLFRKKYFEINDKKAGGSEILKTGDKVAIFLGEETYDKYHTSSKSVLKNDIDINVTCDIDIKSRIVYEDDNIIIFNKPVNMLSQGDRTSDVSVNSLLLDYIDLKNNIFKPSIVNRLDRNTSGIIIFAKTNVAARAISTMIKENELEKRYKTRVNGIVKKDEDTIVHLYKKDTSKNIAIIKDYKDHLVDGYSLVKLSYKVIKRFNDTTELDINLITGKSHQIRAQLSHIGYPIVCDKKYMDKSLYEKNVIEFKKRSQVLCCYKIRFASFEEETLRNLSNKVFKI